MLGTLAPATSDRAALRLRMLTLIVATVMTAVGVLFLFTPPAVQGIPQRVFVGLAAAWIIFFAARARAWPATKNPDGTNRA